MGTQPRDNRSRPLTRATQVRVTAIRRFRRQNSGQPSPAGIGIQTHPTTNDGGTEHSGLSTCDLEREVEAETGPAPDRRERGALPQMRCGVILRLETSSHQRDTPIPPTSVRIVSTAISAIQPLRAIPPWNATSGVLAKSMIATIGGPRTSVRIRTITTRYSITPKMPVVEF